MESINNLIARSSALISARDTSIANPTTQNLIIALMSLLLAAVVVGGALYIVRRSRKARAAKQTLPQFKESGRNASRLTITTSPYNGRTSSIYVYDEKSSMMSNASSPPLSPDSVPEIRITFPDEEDESGRQKGGRVVIVRVGEHGIGLEPLRDEQLPAYEKETGGRFQSIDMDRIGGLKEKSSWN